MKVTQKVTGLRELDAMLGELGLSAAKGVLRRVGRKALQPMDQAWRAKAPHLTGALEESGSVGSKLSRSQRKARVRESLVEVFAGPGPNPAAVQQEFGNANHSAQPFMRPSWDETQGQASDIVKAELRDEIMKTAKRQARKRDRAAAAAEG